MLVFLYRNTTYEKFIGLATFIFGTYYFIGIACAHIIVRIGMADCMAICFIINSLTGALKTFIKKFTRISNKGDVNVMYECSNCGNLLEYEGADCPYCLGKEEALQGLGAQCQEEVSEAECETVCNEEGAASESLAIEIVCEEEEAPVRLTYAEKKLRRLELEYEIAELKSNIKPLMGKIAEKTSRADENGYTCSLKCIARLVNEAKEMDDYRMKRETELEGIVICDQCDYGFAVADKFCGSCGDDLGETGWACTYCPTRNKDENEYCRCCGLMPPPPPKICVGCNAERPIERSNDVFCALCGGVYQ